MAPREPLDIDETVTQIPSPVAVTETEPAILQDGGYGWVCVCAAFIVNAFTWGMIASYGVYLSYYLTHDVYSNATDIDYAFVGGANFAAALIVSPMVNGFIRRWGTNRVMFLGCLTYLCGFLCASFAKQFWELILSQGVLVGAGVGMIWQPSTSIISQWFKKRRSMAQSVTSAGSGCGGIMFSLAATPMIENLSLSWALRITGLTGFTMLSLASFLMRDRNHFIRPSNRILDKKLFQSVEVWLVYGWASMSVFGYVVLLYSLAAYGRSIGLSQNQSGIVVAVMNAGAACGRPLVGVTSDRWGRVTVACALTMFSGIISFAVWIPATTYAPLLCFAVLTGSVQGTFWATVAPISGQVVDLVHLPSMLALGWLIIVLPTFFSQAIALELREPRWNRPYLIPQVLAGISHIIAASFLLELRRRKWGLTVKEKNN